MQPLDAERRPATRRRAARKLRHRASAVREPAAQRLPARRHANVHAAADDCDRRRAELDGSFKRRRSDAADQGARDGDARRGETACEARRDPRSRSHWRSSCPTNATTVASSVVAAAGRRRAREAPRRR